MRAQRIAQARQQLAQDRTYATGRLTEFRSAQRQRIAALQQAQPGIDQAFDNSERQGAAQVAQAAATQSAAIRAAVAGALAQAQGAAAAARAQISAAYATTTQTVEATTGTARSQIEASYQQSVAATRASEARQMGQVGQLYTQAEGAFHAAASAAGTHAVSVASQRAAEYRSHKINEDDSFLDGPLTDNRCEAQADAAEKVGQAYRDELAKEGDKQVEQMAIENFTRPSGANTPKSLFPPGTTRAQVESMGTEGLNRALTDAPGSTHTPPTAPNTNGEFTATVMGPNGHPIIIRGFYRPTATGGFEIQSVFPSTQLGAGTIPVPGGTGLGGSRSVPLPIYIHPPASSDARDQP